MDQIRCPKCNRLLGYFRGEGVVLCPRCRKDVKVYFNTVSKTVEIKGSAPVKQG